MSAEREEVTIVSLVHDVKNKRSIVTLAWDDPDKRLALPVPFGTSIDDIFMEAREAVRELADRLANLEIRDHRFPKRFTTSA